MPGLGLRLLHRSFTGFRLRCGADCQLRETRCSDVQGGIDVSGHRSALPRRDPGGPTEAADEVGQIGEPDRGRDLGDRLLARGQLRRSVDTVDRLIMRGPPSRSSVALSSARDERVSKGRAERRRSPPTAGSPGRRGPVRVLTRRPVARSAATSVLMQNQLSWLRFQSYPKMEKFRHQLFKQLLINMPCTMFPQQIQEILKVRVNS